MATPSHNTPPPRALAAAATACDRAEAAIALLRRRIDAPVTHGPDHLAAALVQHIHTQAFIALAALTPQGGEAGR